MFQELCHVHWGQIHAKEYAALIEWQSSFVKSSQVILDLRSVCTKAREISLVSVLELEDIERLSLETVSEWLERRVSCLKRFVKILVKPAGRDVEENVNMGSGIRERAIV